MAKAINDSEFNEKVIQSSVPVLVDFWAPWCGPCKIMEPIIENITKKVYGSAKVYKLNVDENPATASRYNITGIPTVIIFNKGEIVNQFVGVQQEKVYQDALEAML